jgi:uncharacterized membrane protein YeiB
LIAYAAWHDGWKRGSSRNVVGFYNTLFCKRVGSVGAMGALFMADVVIFMGAARFVEVMKEVICDYERKRMAAAAQRRALVEFWSPFFEVGLLYNLLISAFRFTPLIPCACCRNWMCIVCFMPCNFAMASLY